MLFDHLRYLTAYRTLSPNVATAVDYLTSVDLQSLPLGRQEVAGERVFAVVHSYTTKPATEARWEAHRRYIDIQLMLDGQEQMNVADIAGLAVSVPYDAERDVVFFGVPATSQRIVVEPMQFALFLPHDAHQPTVQVSAPMEIRKLVLKIENDVVR